MGYVICGYNSVDNLLVSGLDGGGSGAGRSTVFLFLCFTVCNMYCCRVMFCYPRTRLHCIGIYISLYKQIMYYIIIFRILNINSI